MGKIALLAPLALGACSSSPPPHGVQLNDLAILMPMATDEASLSAYITPSTIGDDGEPLFPKALFAADPLAIDLSYDDLRATALRIDPCFARLGGVSDPATCDSQLRLTFQPVTFVAGAASASAADAAVCVTYELSTAQLEGAVDAIASARASYAPGDLGAIGVHPIIAMQGLGGDMARDVLGAVTQYAGAAQISEFVALIGDGSSAPPSAWDFHGIDVDGATTVPLEIPTLEPSRTDMSVAVTSVAPFDAQFDPVSTSPDNLALLADTYQVTVATPAMQQAAFDAALRVENPNLDSANTIDCATCHVAELARQLVGEQTLHLSPDDPFAYMADPSIPAADLAASVADGSSIESITLHAFSYRGTVPFVAQRTVDETAASLTEYIQLTGEPSAK